LIATLRKTRGVSFDAPMSMAVHITDTSAPKLKVPLSPWPRELDSRWPEKETREFLELAGQFAKEARFDEFMKAHQPLYDLATSRMTTLLHKEFHAEWFDKFFGARLNAQFHLVLGMLNGPNSYGVRVKVGDVEELYCVLGVWERDWLGNPGFTRNVLPTVVHEFCHSYANPCVDRHVGELEAAGRKIFPRVKEKMGRMAYGNWQTMMYESLVRACVVRYRMTHEGREAAEQEIAEEQKRGFLWIKELVARLDEYEADRQKYPTVESFFPRVVEFFDAYSKKD
jgi:hypothetical protein